MSSFATLMAISSANTEAQKASVEKIRLERKRKEEETKRKKIEQEKKQRELEQKLREKHFEEQKKEVERQKKREEEERLREATLRRRAEEQKNALLYGPKKASKASSGSRASSSQPRDRKRSSEEGEEPLSSAKALTRQELREQKLQAELARSLSTSKRTNLSGGYHKSGKVLRGGAVDVTTAGLPNAGGSGQGKSIRERLAAMPNTLTKLNTNKRDTRTIDEILQDRAKAKELKTLDGEQAREFNDWFVSPKKTKEKSPPTASTSGTNTPNSRSSAMPSSQGSNKAASHLSSAKRPAPPAAKVAPTSKPISKPIPKSVPKSSTTGSSKYDKSTLPSISKSGMSDRSSRPSARSSLPTKKRPHSSSRSESPYSKRRAVDSEELDDEAVDYSSMIWEIMGKKKSDYVSRDVFSDDESDMEADASDLEREEKKSARIAKREDQLAMLEEQRREEEKKRRRLR